MNECQGLQSCEAIDMPEGEDDALLCFVCLKGDVSYVTLPFVMGTTQSHVLAINCAARLLCRYFLMGPWFCLDCQ